MTRFNTTEIINQVNNRLPDNTSGAITPSVLRNILTDIIMTLRGTGAYLAGTTDVSHNFTTSAFQQVPALYTEQVTRDATEITTQLSSGQLTAMYESDYNIKGSFSIEGANNERVILGIAVNGAVSEYFKVEEQMAGAGQPTEINIDAVVHLTVGDTIAVWFSAPTSPATLTVANPATTLTLLPSRV